jgi:hypothetical protein
MCTTIGRRSTAVCTDGTPSAVKLNMCTLSATHNHSAGRAYHTFAPCQFGPTCSFVLHHTTHESYLIAHDAFAPAGALAG